MTKGTTQGEYSKYEKQRMRWYIKGLRYALVFAPDTETDGGACSDDIIEEVKMLEEKYGLRSTAKKDAS